MRSASRTDDLGDSSETSEHRRRVLKDWRQSLHRALQGKFDDPLLPALADTVTTYGIPVAHLEAVIDGVEMDLEPAQYDTFEQLSDYCHRVATAVGLACLPIWGFSGEGAEEPARRCGLAFQMTNILRDLKEDASRNRVYLPREDFDRFGYTVADLRAGVRDGRFRQLMRFQIERVERLYLEGAELDGCLSPDGRRIFGSMMSVYRALLAEIKRLDGDVFTTRVQLSSWRKCGSPRGGSYAEPRASSRLGPFRDDLGDWARRFAGRSSAGQHCRRGARGSGGCRGLGREWLPSRAVRSTPHAGRARRIVSRSQYRRTRRSLSARKHGLLHEPDGFLSEGWHRPILSPRSDFALRRARWADLSLFLQSIAGCFTWPAFWGLKYLSVRDRLAIGRAMWRLMRSDDGSCGCTDSCCMAGGPGTIGQFYRAFLDGCARERVG